MLEGAAIGSAGPRESDLRDVVEGGAHGGLPSLIADRRRYAEAWDTAPRFSASGQTSHELDPGCGGRRHRLRRDHPRPRARTPPASRCGRSSGATPTRPPTRAALFGIPHALTDRAEAFARDDVDVVAVTTPPHTHAEIVLDAVAAGKHVLCEKPFARDLDEARAMLQAADAAGVVHLLGTEFRFATGQALLTRTVQSGAIGDPRFVLFVLQLPTLHDPAAEMPAWWDDAAEGGGWLGAHGSHVIDQVRTTLGEIARVSASLQTLSPRPMTADDTYTVQFGPTPAPTGSCTARARPAASSWWRPRSPAPTASAWPQGDEVWIDTGAGPTQVPPPDDLPVVAAGPAAERAAAHHLRHVALDRHRPRAVHPPLRGDARPDPRARTFP